MAWVMSASTLVRPAMLAAMALGVSASLAGCGEVQNDGHMFQRWSDQVEQIKVSDQPPGETADATAAPSTDPAASQTLALRQPMKIDVVDRINMPTPDAATLRSVIRMVHASVVSGPAPAETEIAGLRRPIESGPVAADKSGRFVQLAAFTSDADARAAWRKFAATDPAVFARLAPRFERADLGDKGQWIRVKVALPAASDAAHRVCAAAKLSPERCA